jgi:hypothetical protein
MPEHNFDLVVLGGCPTDTSAAVAGFFGEQVIVPSPIPLP